MLRNKQFAEYTFQERTHANAHREWHNEEVALHTGRPHGGSEGFHVSGPGTTAAVDSSSSAVLSAGPVSKTKANAVVLHVQWCCVLGHPSCSTTNNGLGSDGGARVWLVWSYYIGPCSHTLYQHPLIHTEQNHRSKHLCLH